MNVSNISYSEESDSSYSATGSDDAASRDHAVPEAPLLPVFHKSNRPQEKPLHLTQVERIVKQRTQAIGIATSLHGMRASFITLTFEEDPKLVRVYFLKNLLFWFLSNETEGFADAFLSAILLFISDERRCALQKFSSPAFLRIGTLLRLLGSALVILGVFFFPMWFLGGWNGSGYNFYPAFYWPLLVNDWLLALPLLSLFFVLGTSIVGLFQITISSRIVIWTRIAAIVGLLTHCLLGFWAYVIFSISLLVHVGPGFGLILLGFMVMIVGTFLM